MDDRVRIKICGLRREADIDAVNEAGPDYAGFVFAPSRRQVTPQQAHRLRARLRPDIPAVGVFVNAAEADILALLRAGVIDMAQLHGQEDEAAVRRLKALSGKPVIRAVQVKGAADIAASLDSAADWLLLDSGAGSGFPFDWTLAARCARPYFLAGGLHAGNLRQAIERLHPFAVDVSSGVETGGVKDREKIAGAVALVRQIHWQTKQGLDPMDRKDGAQP